MTYRDDTGELEVRGTFEIHKAEGHSLFSNGEYKKAIGSYTTALELRENDKDCLVCRSRCYLMLGDNDSAFKDAETSLSEQPDYHKGIYQKAEALYAKGEFEWALMFYHRGHKLRPEMQEFRLGIQKAQEAIDNAVGSPDSVKLTKDGDLSYFENQIVDKKTTRGKTAKQANYNRSGSPDNKEVKSAATHCKDKTVKQLLGELYGDRLYLEILLKDTVSVMKSFNDELNAVIKRQTGSKSIPTSTVNGIVHDSILYLDKRTEFWRQQKPMYARKRDRLISRSGKRKANISANDYILKELKKIDHEQFEGKFKDSLTRAVSCMRFVDHHSMDTKDGIQNRASVVAHLHSYIGTAYLESGNYGKALVEFQKDYILGKEKHMNDSKCRALDNMGIVYAKQKNFEKAVSTWMKSLQVAKTPIERVWLYHEIGRCHLEMGNYEKAKEYGQKSVTSSIRAGDQVWQLRATVLVAQSDVKLSNLHSGLDMFDTACDMAKIQCDETAENVIKQAMAHVNSKIIRNLRKQKKAEELKKLQENVDLDSQNHDTDVSVQISSPSEQKTSNDTSSSDQQLVVNGEEINSDTNCMNINGENEALSVQIQEEAQCADTNINNFIAESIGGRKKHYYFK